jgi:hypothetical protein
MMVRWCGRRQGAAFAQRGTAALVLLTALAGCGTTSDGGGAGPDLPDQASNDPLYRVRDTGLRCVTHPCFNLEAMPVAGGEAESLSDLELEDLGLSEDERSSLLEELGGSGITVAGRIEVVPRAGPAGDGRVLRVSRLVRRA